MQDFSYRSELHENRVVISAATVIPYGLKKFLKILSTVSVDFFEISLKMNLPESSWLKGIFLDEILKIWYSHRRKIPYKSIFHQFEALKHFSDGVL